MRVRQLRVDQIDDNFDGLKVQLVLAFGAKSQISIDVHQQLSSKLPHASIIYCSTSGEILEEHVIDDSLVLNLFEFDTTLLQTSIVNIKDYSEPKDAYKSLIGSLDDKSLKHVLLFSDGVQVNGSSLLEAVNGELPPGVSVSGGLAGDGTNFESTFVGLNSNIQSGNLVAVGFYGDNLEVHTGYSGGWTTFGVVRQVTKSIDNELYELDNRPALEIYKTYLAELSHELPASALLFPLGILRPDTNEDPIVRTILGIDEENKSITFAGNIEEGAKVQLMKANVNRLVDGAEKAALNTDSLNASFALLVSCVGRKLVLKQRVEEEIEIVKNTLGDNTVLGGFYSYGELCPKNLGSQCLLHNQTMSITTFFER